MTVAFTTSVFDTRLPVTTGHNQTITLEDRTETIRGVAIKVNGANNKIIIRNCKLKADKLLVASQPNIEISIINSIIKGAYGSLPEETVTIDGEIKQKKRKKNNLRSGLFVNGRRVR